MWQKGECVTLQRGEGEFGLRPCRASVLGITSRDPTILTACGNSHGNVNHFWADRTARSDRPLHETGRAIRREVVGHGQRASVGRRSTLLRITGVELFDC